MSNNQELPELLREILLTPYARELQQVEAERTEEVKEMSNHEPWCTGSHKQGPCPADSEPEQFTQQDHEEYNEYLDQLYAAEELERVQRERDENVSDH